MRELRKHDKDSAFLAAINRIDRRRGQRNTAMHELTKVADGEKGTWEEKIADLPGMVVEGCEALLEVDALDRAERNAVGNLTGTEPHGFSC